MTHTVFKIEKSEIFNKEIASFQNNNEHDWKCLEKKIENQLNLKLENKKEFKSLKTTSEFKYWDSPSNTLFLIKCYLNTKRHVITLDKVAIIEEKESKFAFVLSILAGIVTVVTLSFLLTGLKIREYNQFCEFVKQNTMLLLVLLYYILSSLATIYHNYKHNRIIRKPLKTTEIDKVVGFIKNFLTAQSICWLDVNQIIFASCQILLVMACLRQPPDFIINRLLLIALCFSLYFFSYSVGKVSRVGLKGLFCFIVFFVILGWIGSEIWLAISLLFTLFSNLFTEDVWKLTQKSRHPLFEDKDSHYNRHLVDKQSFKIRVKLSLYSVVLYLFLYLTKDIQILEKLLILNLIDKGKVDYVMSLFLRGTDRTFLFLGICIFFIIVKTIVKLNFRDLIDELITKIYDYIFCNTKLGVPVIRQEVTCYYQELDHLSPKIVIENLEELPRDSIFTWLTDLVELKKEIKLRNKESLEADFVIRYPSGELYKDKVILKISNE